MKIHVVSADLGRWTRTSIWMVASTLVGLVLNRGQRKFLSQLFKDTFQNLRSGHRITVQRSGVQVRFK
jgi:hypothetical protein